MGEECVPATESSLNKGVPETGTSWIGKEQKASDCQTMQKAERVPVVN